MAEDTPKQLLGDLTAEKMKQLRLDRVAKRFSQLTGLPCKCADRQDALNKLHKRLKGDG